MISISLLINFWILLNKSFGQGIHVKIHEMSSGYTGHEDFAKLAGAKLEQALNSAAFRQAINSGAFTKTQGLNNQQLLEKVMLAREVDINGADSVVDLRVRTITAEVDGERWIRNCQIGSSAGTIGIDGGGDGITAICSSWLEKYHSHNDVASLAGHYAHEYMHMLGFSHRWPGKYRSFVYQVGNIVENIINSGRYDIYTIPE